MAAACDDSPLDAEPEPADDFRLYSDVGGVGPGHGVEWQIDAPWRMEPDPSSAQPYDRLPIVVTFHDMDMQSSPGAPYGRFCGLYVLRTGSSGLGPVTYIPASDFHEIEASKRWLNTGYLTPEPDNHLVRRMWAGDSPEDVQTLSQWSEWHGTALYDFSPSQPGEDVKLLVMARVSRHSQCSPEDMALTDMDLLWQQKHGRVADMPEALSTTFNEFLKVHYAAQPMPRFDDGWIYGDLHYHSQGTDNEGESAINYRGVIQAMKAMGVDYVFATEHASNSHQITGIHTVFVNALPEIAWYVSLIEDWLISKLEEAGAGLPVTEADALRDMSPQRFTHLYHWLNDADGVNAEVSASGRSDRRPQIFLGAELDVIPEISNAERDSGSFVYALKRRYWFSKACLELPSEIIDYTDFEEGDCASKLTYFGSAADRKGVRDVQGLGEIRHARQHLLHLPTPGDDHFIPGDTTEYGGANRWLSTVLDEELAGNPKKGYAFLAHPVEAASGDGVGRLGPDIVPFSDTQLQTAFESPYVLGLQLWNEDSRYKSEPSGANRRFPFLHGEGIPDGELPEWLYVNFNWKWQTRDENHLRSSLAGGTAMWDQVLRWGITPSLTAGVEWLEPDQPRKFFMAGGSDGHGDLNYRREGRFFGWAGSNDTAIGKPRNLTHVGTERLGIEGAVSQTQVLDALRSGEFTITDGPAMRIAIDVNGNGVIDEGDVPMGGDFTIGVGESAPLLVEWKSTPEFGPVREIHVYVGAQAGDHEGVVYAPQGHGVSGAASCVESAPFTDGTGREYCPMTDHYVRDPNGELSITIPVGAEDGFEGARTIELDPSDYPVFDYECTREYIDIWLDDHWESVEVVDCSVSNVETPSRLYTRAFVRTEVSSHEGAQLHLLRRYAFSNPIWMTAQQVASPPSVSVTRVGCSENVNSFSASVSPGSVPGALTKQYKVGSTGVWQTLSSDSFTAPGGNWVWVRAQACNDLGCSAYTSASTWGPTCLPPAPSAPSVHVEWVQCSYGTNSFVYAVSSTDPQNTASMTKQYKIGSGSWQTLSSSTINAGSSQTVSVRARACNAYGSCSSYAQASAPGPYCSVGGGGTHPL
ncbi:MAG: hypothetical protein R6X02_06515 [Enhygromyxa sp.]